MSSDKIQEYKQLSTEDADVQSAESTADSSKYITNEISKRTINWYGYKQQSYITDDTLLKQLSEFDPLFKQYISTHSNDSRAQLYSYIHRYGSNIVYNLIQLLDKIQAKETVEYIVVMIYTIIDLSNNPATQTNTVITSLYTEHKNTDYYTVFLKIISNLGTEKYHIDIVNTASLILANLLSYDKLNGLSAESTPLVNYTRYLNHKLQSYNANNNTKQLLAINNQLKVLLRNNQAHIVFFSVKGVETLTAVLSNTQHAQHTQLLYCVGFNIWLLSYNRQILEQCQSTGLIKIIVNVIKSTGMEKITRIYYAIIKNILLHLNGQSPDGAQTQQHTVDKKLQIELIEQLIGSQLLQSAEAAYKKRYKDADLMSDIEYVIQQLRQYIDQLSNFELYSSEVISGVLTWSPAHTNPQFWRDNINKFDADDYKLIKQLIQLLNDPNEEIREIACYDLGEIAVYHPEGKQILNKLNAKPRLLALLQDSSPKVRKQALLAIQKTLVQNWESLAKASQQGVQSLVSQQQKK